MERNVMGELNVYRGSGAKPNFSEIARRHGMDRHTVAKYWREGESAADGRSARGSAFDPLEEETGSWQLRRRVGRIVSQVFRGRDAATVTAMYHAACDMLEGCCPRAAAVLEEAEPDALAYLDFPPAHWKRLRTNNVQERTNREIKRRSRVVQVFPSTGSLVRLAGAAMCEQDEIWQESRYFSEARMNELYDEGRIRGVDGPVDWGRLEAEARRMLESGLELADRVEAA